MWIFLKGCQYPWNLSSFFPLQSWFQCMYSRNTPLFLTRTHIRMLQIAIQSTIGYTHHKAKAVQQLRHNVPLKERTLVKKHFKGQLWCLSRDLSSHRKVLHLLQNLLQSSNCLLCSNLVLWILVNLHHFCFLWMQTICLFSQEFYNCQYPLHLTCRTQFAIRAN